MSEDTKPNNDNDDELTPQSKGGKARRDKLTPEQRKEIAAKGAEARWGKKIPKALYTGTVTIGTSKLPCAVLDDGTRVLSQGGFLLAIGRSRTPKGGTGVLKGGVDKTPSFLAARNLKSLLTDELVVSTTPVEYTDESDQSAFGFRAEALPRVCAFFADALEKKLLRPNQLHIGVACKLLNEAFADIGIIALVDEATGYQRVRSHDALQKILEAYISPEFLPWQRRFPPSFYEQMFRLNSWEYNPPSVKRPILVGKLTEKIVYKKLPPGVLEELKAKNPKNAKGRRKYKHHQLLTDDIGNPHLEKHLAVVTALMRASTTWRSFLKLLEKAVPNPSGVQLELLDDDDGE